MTFLSLLEAMDNQECIAQSDNVSLIYQVAGRGENVLFIGGTGWDLRASPSPLDSPLTENFTVALYDQRGMGRSDKPKGPYSMRTYADDAIAVVDALGWERAHIVGYSFGGMVAQEVAINYPDSVRKLVIAASTPGGPGKSSYPVHELLHLDPYERARQGLEIADLRFTKSYQKNNPMEANEKIQRRIETQTRYMDEPGAKFGLQQQLMARAEHNCFDRLEKITARTLVLAGNHDGQAPISAQQLMAEKISNSVFVSVDGSHNFLFESNQAYDVISNFLDLSDCRISD